MERINTTIETRHTTDEQELKAPPIFGLRYLEEEATEIHDVVGCLSSDGLMYTGCDEHADMT